MYTHTFELVLNGCRLEGEVSFNDEVKMKYNDAPELTLEQFERINIFFKAVKQLNAVACQNLVKIEISEK